MSDLRPERDWFEKADQDLEMAGGRLGRELPCRPWPAITHSKPPRST